MAAAFSGFFAEQGQTWKIAQIQVFGCLVNIVLDWLLIFGHWGLPEMGIKGAGLASTVAAASTALIAMMLFLFQNQSKTPTRSFMGCNRHDLLRLIKFGAPSGLQNSLEVAGFTFFCFMFGILGDTALAAFTIALTVNMISFMPLIGLSDGLAILVGREQGAGNSEIAQRAAFRSLQLAIVYMIFMAVIFVGFPELLIGFFSPQSYGNIDYSQIVSYGKQILACAAVYNFFDATYFTFLGALRGAGDTRIPMLISVSGHWLILVPGSWILTHYFSGTLLQLWMFITVFVGLMALAMWIRFRSGNWKNIKVVTLVQGPNHPIAMDASTSGSNL